MKTRSRASIIIATFVLLLVSGSSWANVPAPPVNQQIGVDDGIFNNLAEADCRVCHDDPSIVSGPSNLDRHHLLYNQPIPRGQCSVNRNTCTSNANCNANLCSSSGAACTISANCPDFDLGEVCGEVCIGESVVPVLDGNKDGAPDTTYTCLNCHKQAIVNGVITFLVERNCLACHVQVPGEASVHHLTGTAQGTNSPLGDPLVGDCTPCHGTLVDDIGDTHLIPTYDPSLVTPAPSGGTGLPLNSRQNGAGACNYCHDSGTDTASAVPVFSNEDTHHNTGVFLSETGVANTDTCLWCHDINLPEEDFSIRTCEGCHGYESLHNIQTDSPKTPTGTIVVGGENAGYGHIGRDAGPGDSDCWGCHGFAQAAAAAGSGPVTPSITSPTSLSLIAGADAQITLTGSAFTNMIEDYVWTSDLLLTASNGSAVTLSPDTISEGSLTVTIPGTTAVGNYTLQAVKGDLAASNPVVISLKPAVVITETACSNGILTVIGSGFGDELPEGAEEYLNAKVGGMTGEIISWTDTQITAATSLCNEAVTVNALYGSASTCSCEGNFDGDADQDGTDAFTFKTNFGRSRLGNPCTNGSLCSGDFDCDSDVDGTDAVKMKEDFGRSTLLNPCPSCAPAAWCAY